MLGDDDLLERSAVALEQIGDGGFAAIAVRNAASFLAVTAAYRFGSFELLLSTQRSAEALVQLSNEGRALTEDQACLLAFPPLASGA